MADPAADVENLPGDIISKQGQSKSLGDIIDMNEIAPLLAIFKNERRVTVEKARGEDGENARIGIGERLSGTKHVKQAKGHAFHAVMACKHQRQSFLDIFGECIDRAEVRALGLRRRQRNECFAQCADRIPRAGTRNASFGIINQNVILRPIKPFAINAH